MVQAVASGRIIAAAQALKDYMSAMPCVMALILGLAKTGGALLMLWGGPGPDWATRLYGLIFTVTMIGAIVTVDAPYRWDSINMGNTSGRGMEFQVLITAVLLLYVFKSNT